MLPQFRHHAPKPLEEACVIFAELGRTGKDDELEDCRKQLKHLKALKQLATEEKYARDAGPPAHERFTGPSLFEAITSV